MASKKIEDLLLKDGRNEGDSFEFVYRGHSEIDKHYTRPMLPWIISEIKNQRRTQQVTVYIKDGNFEVRDKVSNQRILNHTVRQIHKCVMEQADRRCFLYTLRPPSLLSLGSRKSSDVDSEKGLLPSNISTDYNYHCHLYQALTEQEVRNFFATLRQQPREIKAKDNDGLSSLNSLAELSVHTESQFFEVLFVGRVKVSHFKVPATFIDEALQAFHNKERERQRNVSGESKQRSSPSRMVSFQQEGSGYSVPNIVLRTPLDVEALFDKCNLKENQDNGQGKEGQEDISLTDLKFILKKLETAPNVEQEKEPPCIPKSSPPNSPSLLYVEPSKRVRTLSSTEDESSQGNVKEIPTRNRAGSMGSAMLTRYRTLRPSESDLKALGYDFNRTMLFHIGHREIQLVNPELKSVQLNKPFKDIAGCCQGVKASDHFGFICRELSNDSIVYVGYIFRCEKSSVADEIMQVLNRSFSAMHEAHQKERQEHLMCDYCPLKWFSQLCAEVEGLPAAKAHQIIMKKVSALPDDERESTIAKYEGAETSDLAHKNNVLMMLLRTHFEYKQSNHSHPSQSASRNDSSSGPILESSLMRAKKSLTSSFSHLLKRDQRSSESTERESTPPESAKMSVQKGLSVDSSVQEHSLSPMPTPEKPVKSDQTSAPTACMLGITDSPLRSHRPRSSTLSAADGASMRKELIAKKAILIQKQRASTESVPTFVTESAPATSLASDNSKITSVASPNVPSISAPTLTISQHDKSPPKQATSYTPKRKTNIFNQLSSPSSNLLEEVNAHKNSTPTRRPSTAFRHAILQRVVSPGKGAAVADTPNRKSSVEKKFPYGDQQGCLRSRKELKLVWKKAVFQQIILNKIERENQRLRALQNEAALQRVRLNYDEEDLPSEAVQAWELLLSRPSARIDSNVLYSGIRQGVPKVFRGRVWELFMFQDRLFKELAPFHNSKKVSLPPHFDDPYEEMLKVLTSQQHAILIDLGRTFPSHPYFTQALGPGQLSLFNLLKAYSILDMEVGYCQGLSFVGGVLLLHVDEETAYQLFKHLMFEKNCRKQYRPDLDGLQILLYQLSRLLHDKLNDLYLHLEFYSITPQLYAAPWFLTLFASQFPLNFVSKVFDFLFLMGMEAIICIGYVLLKIHEQELMSLHSFEHIMDYFKSSMSHISANQLNAFFNEVSDCNFSKEFAAYEVEFQVLQEELSVSPQQDADINKLRESLKNLKRQNLDLIEQLQNTNTQQQSLTVLNQNLQQNHHHLEVRVRWLELERNNMRQLINLLSENASKEFISSIPPNLERYLPHKASSPALPEERKMPQKSASDRIYSESKPETSLGARMDSVPNLVEKPLSVQTLRQSSLSPTRSPQDFLPPPPPPPVTDLPPHRSRSSTLDTRSMQNYFKSFLG